MLISAIATGSATSIFMALLASLFLVFCVIPLHEFAHAWTAVKMGDNTPKLMGRYTMNPMAHIDPLGAVLIALIGFGWGKPTPVNPNNFKNRKLGIALTSLAGPLSNLLCGWLFVFFYVVVQQTSINGTVLGVAIQTFFYYAAEISVYLAVLNLIPIPPFDGYGIIQGILPAKAVDWFARNQRIIVIVLLVLLFTNVLTYPLSWLANKIINLFYWLSMLPF